MAGTTTRFSTSNLLEQAATSLLNGPPVSVGVICQWVFSSSIVNRAAGSFIADGIRPWSLLSGNLAAKFPAGTRVQSMVATSLSMTNTATTIGSGTESATFTPTYPLNEDPNYPTTNLLYGKRYVPWHTATPTPDPTVLEFDLGSALPADFFALLCKDRLDTSQPLGTYSSTARSGTAYGTYPNSYFNDHSLAAPYRDAGKVFPARDTSQFWKFELNKDSNITLGGIWLGKFDVDLLLAYWPDSTFRHESNVSRMETGARLPMRFNRGAPRKLFQLEMGGISDAMLTQILGVLREPTRQPVLIDKDDKVFEIALDQDSVEWVDRFNNYHRQTLMLEALR